MSGKQDGYSSRTAVDLERKYNFGKTFAEIYGLATDARNIAEEAKNAYEGLNQEQIFNLLTNYGQSQGIYRGEDGNVYVNASYIKSGKLAISQLPDTVAETSDIPTKTSQLTNDSYYIENDVFGSTETGVTTIVEGIVTTDYIQALGVTANSVLCYNGDSGLEYVRVWDGKISFYSGEIWDSISVTQGDVALNVGGDALRLFGYNQMRIYVSGGYYEFSSNSIILRDPFGNYIKEVSFEVWG